MRAEGPASYQPGASPQGENGKRTRAESPIHPRSPRMKRAFSPHDFIPSFENKRTLGTSRRGRKPTSALSRARLRSDPRLHTSPVISERWYDKRRTPTHPPRRCSTGIVQTLKPIGILHRESGAAGETIANRLRHGGPSRGATWPRPARAGNFSHAVRGRAPLRRRRNPRRRRLRPSPR